MLFSLPQVYSKYQICPMDLQWQFSEDVDYFKVVSIQLYSTEAVPLADRITVLGEKI